jgi:anthrone oxygenase-like protein
MIATVINFADMMLAALVVGGMFGVWLMLNPARRAADLYITLHQQGIRTLNTALPAFGAANVILSIAAAVLARGESARFSLLVATAVCFTAAGLITRLHNQQINALVITWKSDAPPANWMDVSDEWLRWHFIRLLAGVGGLSLLIAATLWRG